MEKTLEQIIKARRSTRSFGAGVPSSEQMKAILESAVYAPYGGATGIPLKEIRRLFVLPLGTVARTKFDDIFMKQLAANGRKLRRIITFLPFMRKKLGSFAGRIEKMVANGIPALEQAPYIVIIAEKKGFPLVEKQSMAHALENMWLTATDLDLGFQLISAIGTLSGNKKFMELLGLEPGKYGIEGCAIGYAKKKTERPEKTDTDKFVKWFA